MRVIRLKDSGLIYSSNVYLVLGNWSGMSDVNTLVDVGRDPAVLDSLAHAPTGVGKRAVEQVVLTHEHFDHVEMLGAIRERYHPTVCAFRGGVDGVDRELHDGDVLKAGDQTFEVLHTPGHSSDSICLFCPEEGVLFAGDTALVIHSSGGTYEESFATALAKICTRDVRAIYFGHGAPLLEDCNLRLQGSLEIVRKSLGRSTDCSTKTKKVICEVV